MMASNLVGPVIGSGSPLAAAPLALEPHVVPGSSGLPTGCPATLKTQLAWSGEQFKNDESYIYRLSGDDIVEAETALGYFKCELPRARVSTRLSSHAFPNIHQIVGRSPLAPKANPARPTFGHSQC